MDDTQRKDPVIEAYKAGVDKTLLIENLRRTPAGRLDQLQRMMDFYEAAQVARKGKRNAHE